MFSLYTYELDSFILKFLHNLKVTPTILKFDDSHHVCILSASKPRMMKVSSCAVFGCFFMYIVTALFGYLTFYSEYIYQYVISKFKCVCVPDDSLYITCILNNKMTKIFLATCQLKCSCLNLWRCLSLFWGNAESWKQHKISVKNW